MRMKFRKYAKLKRHFSCWLFFPVILGFLIYNLEFELRYTGRDIGVT